MPGPAQPGAGAETEQGCKHWSLYRLPVRPHTMFMGEGSQGVTQAT